jgi:hypothetical protein
MPTIVVTAAAQTRPKVIVSSITFSGFEIKD